MLKLRIMVALGTLSVLTGCMTGKTNGTPEKTAAVSVISYSQQAAPADVRKEFRSRFPDAEIISVRKTTFRDGTSEYDVEYREGGEKRSSLMTDFPPPDTSD